MIGLLRGVVARASPEQVILDVGGVGYAVRIPLSTFYEVEQASDGVPVELLIYTQVRDDAIELFGFWTEAEKVLFEKLVAVGGIGPRLAQSVLSGMAPPELIEALAAGDVPRLVRIPGIGKKTAERMVLELRDAARTLAHELPLEQARAPTPVHEDVVAALVNLGYRQAEAERAAAEVDRELEDAAFPELLRASLKRLSRA